MPAERAIKYTLILLIGLAAYYFVREVGLIFEQAFGVVTGG